MSSLNPNKLHVKFIGEANQERPREGRHYTLTHSDQTGDLFLSIGYKYDKEAISGWYTRLMRDEVLAKWQVEEEQPALHVHCHVSGGIVFGSASFRYRIFQHHMNQVLQAFRYGDRDFVIQYPQFDTVPVILHFHSNRRRFNRIEKRGQFSDYNLVKETKGS